MTTFVDASAVIPVFQLDAIQSDLDNAMEHLWNGIEFTDAAQPPRNLEWGPNDLYLLERDLVRTMMELRAAKRLLSGEIPEQPGETETIPRANYDGVLDQIGYAVDYVNWMLGELNTSLDPWYNPLNWASMERTCVQTIQYVKAAKRGLTYHRNSEE